VGGTSLHRLRGNANQAQSSESTGTSLSAILLDQVASAEYPETAKGSPLSRDSSVTISVPFRKLTDSPARTDVRYQAVLRKSQALCRTLLLSCFVVDPPEKERDFCDPCGTIDDLYRIKCSRFQGVGSAREIEREAKKGK
jgi:hypothetical protein